MSTASRPPHGGSFLQGIFRWIGEHVRGFHAAVGVFLTLGLALVLLAGALFALLAALVVREATLPMDEAVLLWLDAQRTGTLDKIMHEITALGSGTVVIMVAVVGSTFLWLTAHHYSAVLLWVAALGGFPLNYLLKEVFDRARPELFEWATHASHLSFPSGHAMNAVIAYGSVAYLVGRLERARRLRRATWLFAVLLMLLVGLSRPYLGVHYPTDVIAGFIIGFAWVTVCALGIEAIRYFRTREPEIQGVEHDLDRTLLGEKQHGTT